MMLFCDWQTTASPRVMTSYYVRCSRRYPMITPETKIAYTYFIRCVFYILSTDVNEFSSNKLQFKVSLVQPSRPDAVHAATRQL